MEEKIVFKNSKGENLVGLFADISKEKIVILCHGHSSGKSNTTFQTIVPVLNANGISTFRFDFYGNGESDGKFEKSDLSESLDDTLQAINLIKQNEFKKIILLGSSFGGLSSTITASNSKDLYALVLKSPVSNFMEVHMSIYGEKGMAEWKRTGQAFKDNKSTGRGLKLNYSFVEDYLKYDAYEAAKKINIPTLIVHGDADVTVPVSQSQKLVKIIPKAKLVLIKGANHRYEGEANFKQMTQAITDFIIKV